MYCKSYFYHILIPTLTMLKAERIYEPEFLTVSHSERVDSVGFLSVKHAHTHAHVCTCVYEPCQILHKMKS